MSNEIIQVRDVPSVEVAALRERAAARQMSLSGYLRRLIHDEVSRPTMDETLATIAGRDRIEATSSDIAGFIDDDHRS